MVMSAAGSALVAGNFKESDMQGNNQPTRKVKVLRAFFIDRVAQKVDSVIEVSAPFALELRAANKVAFVEDEQVAAQAKVDGKAKKGE